MTTYTRTNEKLEVIVKGLDIKPDDYILAIGGSGDQSFALLEYAKRVLAVDINQRQITRMKKQADCLEGRDYAAFFKRRGDKRYFDDERLEKIREKLSGLEIRKADIFDVCRNESGFNKVYLSNALNGHQGKLRNCLSVVSRSISVEGLVYITNGIIFGGSLDGTGMVVDKSLSHLVYYLSYLMSHPEDKSWDPVVLRKLNEPTISCENISYDKYC